MTTDSFKTANSTQAWDVGANWSTGTIPQPGDAVTINAPSSGYSTVTIAAADPAYTIQSLTMTGAGTNGLTDQLTDSGTLTVTGATTLTGADFSVANGGNATFGAVALGSSGGITVGGFVAGSGGMFTATSVSGNGFADLEVVSGLAMVGTLSGALDINLRSGGTLAVSATSGSNGFIMRGGALDLSTTAVNLTDDLEVLNRSTVDLTSLAYQQGETVQLTRNSSTPTTYTATILSAQGTTLFTFDSIQPGSGTATTPPLVTVSSDAANGTLVTLACFTPGTLIQTPSGELAAGELQIGDQVVTAEGRTKPIIWIGRRSYAGRFLARQPHLLPVRIRAGALGDGLPWRDLLVSPCHALFLAGVLVPAGSLVNGTTIVQERSAERVDYIHIELAEHDLVFAEGAPTETFVDDDSRNAFQNAAEYHDLFPGRTAVPVAFCAPRLTSGYEVEAIRNRLAALTGQTQRAA